MVKLLELFGGIGACSKALERCGIDYEIADYVEIDKYAVKSYNAMHNTNFEPQDITTWDKDLKVDLIMHGSPCQDFSIAGNNAGGDKGSGTRSSLMYETIRIVEKLKPRVVIWENVKNLLSKKHKHNFEEYLEYMHNLGYENYYKVLNAKNYGIPQNRERVFTVSIRKDIYKGYEFPKPTTTTGIENFLLDIVPDELFFTEVFKQNVLNTNYRNNERHKENNIKLVKGEIEGLQIMDYRYDEGLRIRQNKLCPTLTTRGSQSLGGVPVIYQNRKLRFISPLECWRLMGFDDEDFYKAEAVNNNTQLYKQAGNSIVVNVLCEILNNLREVLEVDKTSETTLTVFETDKFFDIAALAEKEPELFEELVKDYPVTNGVYQYKVG